MRVYRAERRRDHRRDPRTTRRRFTRIPDAVVVSGAGAAAPHADWKNRPQVPARAGRAEAESSSGAEPRTETEARVTRICAEVLGLEKTSIDDNFFQLGGHSLLAMSLLSRLSTEFDVELPLAILFEVATLEQLACEIDTRKAAGAAAGVFEGSGSQFTPGLEAPDRLSELSDAEVDAMLEEILKAG